MRYILILLTFSLIFYLLFSKISESEKTEVAIMNASLQPIIFYYIVISEKLAEGIIFTNETGGYENVQYPLLAGSNNNPAIWNYNKSDSKTLYSVFVYGNVELDLCHGSLTNLCSNPGCSGSDNVEINITNVKWTSSLQNDKNNPPGPSAAKSLSVGLSDENKFAKNLWSNTTAYLRYWLNVPPNTPPLNFTTIYQVRAVVAGESCE